MLLEGSKYAGKTKKTFNRTVAKVMSLVLIGLVSILHRDSI
jgi:hypothetical protein